MRWRCDSGRGGGAIAVAVAVAVLADEGRTNGVSEGFGGRGAGVVLGVCVNRAGPTVPLEPGGSAAGDEVNAGSEDERSESSGG